VPLANTKSKFEFELDFLKKSAPGARLVSFSDSWARRRTCCRARSAKSCRFEELAKRGIDPAHPTQAVSGSEAYVSPAEPARNRGTWAVDASGKSAELGVNRPEASGEQGRKLNLYA
jgi:hypothetical protein